MISLNSEITKKVLSYFYLHSHENLYINEIVRKLDVDKRNLVKKLRELENEGLLLCEVRGNLKIFSINKKYSLYREYEKIIQKTVGFESEIKNLLQPIKEISEAYIFGSYAKGKMDVHSDIDLLVVGTHKSIALLGKLRQMQKRVDREINLVNMDVLEFKKRLKDKDPFLVEIINKKHIKIK